jgi:tRNA (guanine37-N1)-methyltransferase
MYTGTLMQIGIISLFPDMFKDIFTYGVGRRAIERGQVKLHLVRLGQFSDRVDDIPYGGGKGMVMKYTPLRDAIRYITPILDSPKVILPTPSGKPITQEMLKSWVGCNLLFICGRYEGIDQRIIDKYVDEEVCIGDFVVSGGELPTMMIIDGIFRLLPGVLGNKSSTENESFEDGLLGYPVYTRPVEIDDLQVPQVLLSGHHANIANWRHQQRISKTCRIRKDLLKD